MKRNRSIGATSLLSFKSGVENTVILNFQCTFEIETTLVPSKIQLKIPLGTKWNFSNSNDPQVETWFGVNGTNPLRTFSTTNLRTIKVITLTLSNIVKQDCFYNTDNIVPKFRSVGFFWSSSSIARKMVAKQWRTIEKR